MGLKHQLPLIHICPSTQKLMYICALASRATLSPPSRGFESTLCRFRRQLPHDLVFKNIFLKETCDVCLIYLGLNLQDLIKNWKIFENMCVNLRSYVDVRGPGRMFCRSYEVLRCPQRALEALRGHQKSLEVLRGPQRSFRGPLRSIEVL